MYHIAGKIGGKKIGGKKIWRIGFIKRLANFFNLAILLPAIVLLESEEPLHVCTPGSRGPSFFVINLYSAMLRQSINTRTIT